MAAMLRYENVYSAIRAPGRVQVPPFHREITTRALRNADSFDRGRGLPASIRPGEPASRYR